MKLIALLTLICETAAVLGASVPTNSSAGVSPESLVPKSRNRNKAHRLEVEHLERLAREREQQQQHRAGDESMVPKSRNRNKAHRLEVERLEREQQQREQQQQHRARDESMVPKSRNRNKAHRLEVERLEREAASAPARVGAEFSEGSQKF